MIIALAFYALAAYGLAPTLWRHYERQGALADTSMTTVTKLGIPGDALNVGLEGARNDVLCAMRLAGWSAADPVTLRTSVRIVGSVLAHRAYVAAPVSPLLWSGRAQDLAFEKPSGVSPSTRHHVRFWLALDHGEAGLPVWLGAVTYDRSVGVSHYTGQVTHHIGPDIDAERDRLAADLTGTGHVETTYEISGIGPTLLAHNGGGDPYFTDGEIRMARLRPGCVSTQGSPEAIAPAPAVQAKNRAFAWVSAFWRVIAPAVEAAHDL